MVKCRYCESHIVNAQVVCEECHHSILVKVRRQLKKLQLHIITLRTILLRHHNWHGALGEVALKDENGSLTEIDMSREYDDSHMCEETMSVLRETDNLTKTTRVWIKRFKPILFSEFPTGPFVFDWRSYDIPETVMAAVRNVPSHCVGVSLRPYGGARMIASAERVARKKGIRIIWVPMRSALTGRQQKDDDSSSS